MKVETFTTAVKIGDKEVQKSGEKTVTENSSDILALLQEDSQAKGKDEKETLKLQTRVQRAVNYAFDLWARAEVRNAIMSENIDPNKATDKAFTDFNKARVANGKTELTKEAFAALMAA
jgi:hypothetical protein